MGRVRNIGSGQTRCGVMLSGVVSQYYSMFQCLSKHPIQYLHHLLVTATHPKCIFCFSRCYKCCQMFYNNLTSIHWFGHYQYPANFLDSDIAVLIIYRPRQRQTSESLPNVRIYSSLMKWSNLITPSLYPDCFSTGPVQAIILYV